MEELQEQPKLPRLTLKALNERIEVLLTENRLLAERIEALEQQWHEVNQAQAQASAAVEWFVPSLPESDAAVKTAVAEPEDVQEALAEVPQKALAPRSQRHFTTKKKSFIGSFWLFRSKKSDRTEVCI